MSNFFLIASFLMRYGSSMNHPCLVNLSANDHICVPYMLRNCHIPVWLIMQSGVEDSYMSP